MNYLKLDHTASGWQIMAALSGDHVAAPHVNLVANDAPQSIYNAVAAEVLYDVSFEERCAVEAQYNTASALAHVAADPKLAKKLVKKPLLAMGYGGGDGNWGTGFEELFSKESFASGDAYKATKKLIAEKGAAAANKIAPYAIAWQQYWLAAFKAAYEVIEDIEIPLVAGGSLKAKKYDQQFDDIKIQDAAGGTLLCKALVGETFSPSKSAKSAFAQMIQAFDAAILMKTKIKYKALTNGAPLISKHDSYKVPAKYEDALFIAVQSTMVEVFSAGDAYLASVAAALEEQAGITLPPMPAKGTFTAEDIWSAQHFIDYE